MLQDESTLETEEDEDEENSAFDDILNETPLLICKKCSCTYINYCLRCLQNDRKSTEANMLKDQTSDLNHLVSSQPFVDEISELR